MSLIDKFLGMSYGAIKGMFVGSVWSSIDLYKYMIDTSLGLQDSDHPSRKLETPTNLGKIASAIISILVIPYGIVRGFFVGAYAGFKGGIGFSKEKLSPVHNMYRFFTAHSASREENYAMYEVPYTAYSQYGPRKCTSIKEGIFYYHTTKITLKEYIKQKYIGFGDGNSTNSGWMTLQDLLDDSRYKILVKSILSKYKMCGSSDSFIYTEFDRLNSYKLISFIIDNITDVEIENFLKILLNNKYIQPKDLILFYSRSPYHIINGKKNKPIIERIIKEYTNPMATFLMGSHPKQTETPIGSEIAPIYKELFMSRIFERNILLSINQLMNSSNNLEIPAKMD